MKYRWMIALAAAVLLLTVAQSLTTGAQESAIGEIPKYLTIGMEAYKAEGADAAVKAWIKGSPIDGSKDALSQANVLRQVQDYYGAYKAFEVIRSTNLSTNIRLTYVSINFDKGPLFAKFLSYRSEQGWILTNFAFNTKPENILPPAP
ncbi:MAG TPA: hypothetical protein VEG64_13050 [Candidatus Sulfotelmatobacter sp.]|nr:hypothetical protein [Candidatus Sulfotelmatobacter sp.]